ncbi:hypothetical protein B0I35DRAFT_443765 [Stachybotrys elegans]|uniref:Uncharacterized protein n=1 Tax=Stachybotrys elegans TaxID=80388 RepID=A0A8K0WLF2_9HYPO|nr:hypothetical protein B0I35DRAFT_443765 [Stachybotrys elegans]
MASPANSTIKLPGYGLPGDHKPEDESCFHNLVEDQGEGWTAATLLIREVCMLKFMEEITNKDSWWTKIRDPDISGRWRQEALDQDWPAYHQFADFTPAMADCCIAELRTKADIYEQTGMIPVFDYSACAIKSDKLIPTDLQESLKSAVRALEDIPEEQKDWHPGSGDKVLDLVHPSLWPLVYGRSRILPNKRIGLADCLESCGMGEEIPVPRLREQLGKEEGSYYRNQRIYNMFSNTFQWLPCDVSIGKDGRAKIESYINNLHPAKHADLYPIIEKFIEKSLPAWDMVYRWPEEFDLQRLKTLEAGVKCKTPELCNWACRQTNRPLNEGEEPREEDEAWEPAYARSEREVLDRAWFVETHPLKLPDMDASAYWYEGPMAHDFLSSGFFKEKSRIQVIVKLANIHLTPTKPTYEGGSWHIEGLLNEHICGTALFYYDCENITDSHLSFRTCADRESLSGELNYEQGDSDSISRTFAIDADGSTVQDIGSVLTREGRALFFSNVYQHLVNPFTLKDPTRPGHRKILALFLVDPAIPIISTANVPSQQKDWWLDVTQLETHAASRLPAEITQMVIDSVDFPMDLAEAKRLRVDLMEERSMFHDKTSDSIDREYWRFCEH